MGPLLTGRFSEEGKSAIERLRNFPYLKPSVLILFLFMVAAIFNFSALRRDKAVVWIRGEQPSSANFELSIAKNRKFLQQESLEIAAKDLPPGTQFFSVVYKFRVLKKGNYWVLVAGTPPGSEKLAQEDWFCPYWLSFDNENFQLVSREYIQKRFPMHPENSEYAFGGYEWTRVGLRTFDEGWHSLEIRLKDRRPRDGRYVLYLDGIVLVPQGYRPRRILKDLDPDFFSGES